MHNFIQKNSPDGGFLQSNIWKSFQESIGRTTYSIHKKDFWVNIVKHRLPFVGDYFYIPRGPIFKKGKNIKKYFNEIIELAKKDGVGWIRVEPLSKEYLDVIKKTVKLRIVKSPHNMQPKQIFVLDLSETEEYLLRNMKSKTRYNIRLAKRRGVICEVYKKVDADFEKIINIFLNLSKKTARRKKIRFHKEYYFRKIIKTIPKENIRLYVAKYNEKIIVVNIVIIFGDTMTYLHGASDDKYRNVMAPFLLQWKAILDGKKQGIKKYDFGGIKVEKKDNELKILNNSNQFGITRFKLGFSTKQEFIEFPGSYDIIINKRKYFMYKMLRIIFVIINYLKIKI